MQLLDILWKLNASYRLIVSSAFDLQSDSELELTLLHPSHKSSTRLGLILHRGETQVYFQSYRVVRGGVNTKHYIKSNLLPIATVASGRPKILSGGPIG